jgi:two-component system, NtrC family, response regulator AtoC
VRYPGRILIADDEPLFGTTTAKFLDKNGYEVLYREDGLTVLEDIARYQVALVIADLDMPGNRDLELLNQCRARYPQIPFIVVTGRPTLPSAIEGIRLGIHDYFLKPIELDDLLHSIRRALPVEQATPAPAHGFPAILGSSPAIEQVKRLAERIARSQATVLIRGESGTGKELIARGIHALSVRARGPFVTVDCASIPETLMESTLFGHTRGAFTGADREAVGLVAEAHRGSLFLDEIGELPLAMQAKLLRLLQFGAFVPVGATKESKVDIRILAATNRDLAAEVQRGTFRLDLFYRLSVLEIIAPPLRERAEDIPLLARHFLERIAARDKTHPPRLDASACDALQRHRWPGNVRELENTMERVLCLSQPEVLTAEDIQRCLIPLLPPLDPPFALAPDLADANSRSLQDFHSAQEREYISALLRRHRGNVSQAAREANMSRQGLHKLLKRHGIPPAEFR